jgi:heme-degrading monooxygenase HmoA
MITAMNRIYVVPEYAEQFEERFRTRAGLVDGMPGFIWNKVLRPVNPGDPYVVLTLWESRAAFDAWVNSEAFTKGHARSSTLPKEAFRRPSQLELHEVFTDSSRPDLLAEPRGKPVAFHGSAEGGR